MPNVSSRGRSATRVGRSTRRRTGSRRELRARGVAPGDHVGIYSRNRAEYVEALLGCWKCGAIPVNINWRYVAAELRYVIDDAELVAMIVEDEYLPLLDELGVRRAHRDGRVVAASRRRATSTTCRGPSDDVYMLYTGGTTGMPKGVMWRHEDFFYACCLGGSPLDPIAEPEQIARNVDPVFRMDALALGPLMHGGGQWLTLIGLYGGGKPIVYCERSFDAEKVLDARGARARDVDRHHRRRDGASARGSRARAPRPVGSLRADDARQRRRDAQRRGEGAAPRRLPERVGQRQLRRVGDRRVRAARSARAPRATGPRSPPTAAPGCSIPDTLEKLEPGSGKEGLFARRGHIPLGYWKDEAKTAATFRTDADGVRWVVPGDFATIDDAGPRRAVRSGFGLHQHRRREGLPRRGRSRDPRA